MNGLLFMVLGQMRTMEQISICIFVLSAVGEAFRPANSTAIAHYSSVANRTRSYALNRLAVNLGWSVGPAVGGLLASYSYHLLFWVDGFTCITAAIIMRIFLPPQPAQQLKHTPATHTQKVGSSVYKDGIYLTFIVMVALFATCFFQLSSIVPLYFKEALHMQEARIGAVMGLNGLLIALVEMILVSRLDGKMHSLQYITRGVVIASLGYLSFNLLPQSGVTAIIFILFFTFGEMMCMSFMNSFWISRSGEHNRGQYAALYTIAYAVAGIIAPTLGAYMVEHHGFSSWWYITGFAGLATAAGFHLLYQKLKVKS